MRITRFEDLGCWQEARIIANSIYGVCRNHELKNDFSLSNQLKRAAVSIMANIAEGFARKSDKEFIQFLFIAKSSAAELQSHIYVAHDLKYISPPQFAEIYERSDKLQRKISSLIKYLKSSFSHRK